MEPGSSQQYPVLRLVSQKGYGDSILGNTQNQSGHSPGQAPVTLF